jgi:electron transport complex protein RnfB
MTADDIDALLPQTQCTRCGFAGCSPYAQAIVRGEAEVKCLPPCPVDAIIGARQLTHTIVAALCTGCELCVAPCPVDCIVMMPRSALNHPSDTPDPAHNRERFSAHTQRAARRMTEQAMLIAAKKNAAGAA